MGRTKTTGLVLVAALAVAAACQPQGQPGDEETAMESSAVDTAAALAGIDSLRSAYQEAVAAGDWQRLGGLATPDLVAVNAGGSAWDAVLAASDEAGTPFPPGATLEIRPRETRVLAEDWAYEIGTGTVTWTPEGTDSARTASDSYLVLLHRTAEGWKVHREVASSRPLPEGGEDGEDGG